MKAYYRPIPLMEPASTAHAVPLAGGMCLTSHVERLSRDHPPAIIPLSDVPESVREAITQPRAPVAGLTMDAPRLMGILNVTPDSFSDDGVHGAPDAAILSALDMVQAGADIIDIGGESTRPGALEVTVADEIARTAQVISGVRAQTDTPISIDTRKAAVAKAALGAGANLVNDVSGFTFDPDLAPLCAQRALPVCVMHAQGDPATMQNNPHYDNVLLDVYDYLEDRVAFLVSCGVDKSGILVDPGIGFGKTQAHNLALLRRISLFHTLGCPVLLGASRKRFIGTIGHEPVAGARAPGSIAVALAALGQGVQFLRVHDVAMTKQAVRLHAAIWDKDCHG
jgi:dihydropteroate synthase